MGQGFRAMPTGLPAIVAKFKDIDRKLDAVRRQALSTVSAAVANNSATGLNGSASFVTIVEVHLQVPSGFSRALAHATGSAGASTGVTDGTFVTAAILLANEVGHTRTQWVDPGRGGGVAVSHARLITGLSGGADVGVAVTALTTSPGNVVAGSAGGDLSVSVVFLR